MNGYEERYASWLWKVEELLGRKVDGQAARASYDAMAGDPRVKPLSPEEYAAENPR